MREPEVTVKQWGFRGTAKCLLWHSFAAKGQWLPELVKEIQGHFRVPTPSNHSRMRG